MSPLYLQFWGKARPMADAAPALPTWHPLAFHSLDVAACGNAWLRADPSRAEFATGVLHCDLDDACKIVAFLLALHDAGKFSVIFQAKVPEHFPPLLGPAPEPPGGPAHDTLGYAFLARVERKSTLATWSAGQSIAPLLRAITGHHGRPPSEAGIGPPDKGTAAQQRACRAALETFASDACAVIAPPKLPCLRDLDKRRLGWWLAGVTVLADWLGSAQHWFPYTVTDALTLGAYWEAHAGRRAETALRESGLLPAPPTRAGFRALASDRTPTPVQVLAETLSLPEGPTLLIVEDATGAGKTEAALQFAHRLLAAGRADGVFVALPTMATADAMFARVAATYRALFAADAVPSLALLHGRAAQNDLFRGLILPNVAAAADNAAGDDGDTDGAAQCAAWLASDRRRAFLAHVGVGTIDQALLAVLPVRHAMLRLQGLCRKVLILDEVHAYDAYMNVEIRTLLRFHAMLGGSAILLSATLPVARKAALVAAYRAGLGAPGEVSLQENHYPLVTVAGAGPISEHPCAMDSRLTRSVAIERIDTGADVATRLAEAARAGACAAWVRNTVSDAIAGAALLREAGIAPILFHARFALGDRLAIQGRVLRAFDANSTGPARAGQVVVATQVIEQSLDIDFDLLASDLAPIDLLIQRAGRLWRHDRGPRPVAGRTILVLSPPPVADPPPGWAAGPLGGTRYVYNAYLLWRSARVLFAAGRIETPGNIRELIEAVYAADGLSEVPTGLMKEAAEADGRDKAGAQAAEYATLCAEKGYARNQGAWDSDLRTPTRLGEPSMAFRMARREGDALLPWFADADPDRAWALSEITLRAGIATGAPESEAVRALKAGWRRWEREIPVLVFEQTAKTAVATAFRGSGAVTVSYSTTEGLTKI